MVQLVLIAIAVLISQAVVATGIDNQSPDTWGHITSHLNIEDVRSLTASSKLLLRLRSDPNPVVNALRNTYKESLIIKQITKMNIVSLDVWKELIRIHVVSNDKDMDSVFKWIVAHNLIDLLELLLGYGQITRGLFVCLQHAAMTPQRSKMISMILNQNPRLRHSLKTPIAAAIEANNVVALRTLLKYTDGYMDVTEKSRILYEIFDKYHIRDARQDCIIELLQSGAKPDHTKYDSLSKAALFWYTDIIELFLLYGANINANDKSALRSAISNYRTKDEYDHVRYLFEHGSGLPENHKPLFDAALSTDTNEFLELLLNNGADIKQSIGTVKEYLHKAARYGLNHNVIDHVLYLVERGLDTSSIQADLMSLLIHLPIDMLQRVIATGCVHLSYGLPWAIRSNRIDILDLLLSQPGLRDAVRDPDSLEHLLSALRLVYEPPLLVHGSRTRSQRLHAVTSLIAVMTDDELTDVLKGDFSWSLKRLICNTRDTVRSSNRSLCIQHGSIWSIIS
jgi:hypothetical protein